MRWKTSLRGSVLVFPILIAVAVVMVAACAAEGETNPGSVSLLTDSSNPPISIDSQADPSKCQGFSNLALGAVEPVGIDEVRKAHADAESPDEGEEWVRVAVAGDYDGISPAWTVYALSFALKNAAGDNTYQIKRRPADLIDDEANRIDSYQYYLVSDPIEELTLVCATADADWVLGS